MCIRDRYNLSNAHCEIPVLKRAALFSCLTGLRFSDAKGLSWDNIVPNLEGTGSVSYTHLAVYKRQEFAYRVMAEAQKCRAVEIFKLGGKVYAFDSTTIDLCLSVFEWALFRKKKGGVKIHTLYDIETQIPTFFHITPARLHDTKAMDAIPYEENSFYIFDRAYNDFGRLFTINSVGAYFVVRGKKNNDFRSMRWKRRLPSGVLSDAIGYMDGQLTMSKYPEKIRRIIYLDSESDRKFIFFTNALDINSLKVAELYHNRWKIELFFKWLKQHLKIKKFWGETENAVRIQIYTAITTYCMIAIVQKKMSIERSIYEMLQLVRISLTETLCLKDLFACLLYTSPVARGRRRERSASCASGCSPAAPCLRHARTSNRYSASRPCLRVGAAGRDSGGICRAGSSR